eukprot:1510485-Pleurochrysis_carterae.AAC.1
MSLAACFADIAGPLVGPCAEIAAALICAQYDSRAQVCRRWLIAAADGALWRQTRFSVTSSDEIIRHFSRQEDRRPYSDHTGYWVPCKRLVDKAAMLCRMVALDYVDRDEGGSIFSLAADTCSAICKLLVNLKGEERITPR